MEEKMGHSKNNDRNINFLDKLLERRDEERKMLKAASMAINGGALPLENNRMGLYRWFLNPFMKDIATRALLVWIQEIPPKSRSGKQKTQGGQVHIVLEGHGYTIINGVKVEWEENDAIFLPLLPDGTVHQHFNLDSERWAKLLCVEPNLFDPLGVDKGSGFEQLEDSPDYRPQGQ
jgi:quercetin dioxygenase-like cupin family protein